MGTPTRNIVIFGDTGVGKSSVVNLLLRNNNAKVSNSAIGCTLSFEMQSFGAYCLYDTVGLSEGTKGTVDAMDAVKQLSHLLTSLSDGVSLLIMVIKMGRITTTLQNNYDLFVDTICMNKAPVILMITGCEDLEEDVNSWWTEERHNFERYGMIFSETVSGCAKDPLSAHSVMRPVIEVSRQETRKSLEESINRCALVVPWKVGSTTEWLWEVIIPVLTALASWFMRKKPWATVEKAWKRLFSGIGLTEAKANDILEKLKKSN